MDEVALRHGAHGLPTLRNGIAFSFDSAPAAVACALELQRASINDAIPAVLSIGIQTAEGPTDNQRNENDESIAMASHLCALAHGGQVLLGRSTHDLVADHLPNGAGLRDLGRHRLRDLSHIENVWQLRHPDLRDAFPPPHSLDAVPNNLPLQTTTFIGREREAELVRRHLSSTRLLTITGAGGCGKTRLSFEAATNLLDTFPDGVWWVDLASIADPSLVPKTVASAASVQEIPNQPILETLARSLRDRQALIMLDNCEHVIEACADLAQSVLSTTLSVSLLATSREPLGVNGEVTFRIPSLSFPPELATGTIESLSQYEAVRLFIDRALRAQSDFLATNESAPAIAEICHRLDGIPLAIELAAARTRVLSPDQIAAGLGDTFHVLTGGARTSLPRQRTIEASIDWSHQLLDETERIFLRRLGVFAGGFTLEGAERVCTGAGISESDVLDLLAGLVDKSLVQIDTHSRVGRYRLLETIRHYAGRKLVAADESAIVRTKHLNHMAVLAERAALELEGDAHQAVVESLDPDMDNIRAALEWSLEQDDGSAGLRIAAALWLYWESRAPGEGVGRIRAALARPSDDRRARAAALYGASLLSLTMGDPVSAIGYADEAAAISRETGDERILARSMGFGGMVRMFLDPMNCRPLIEEAVGLARKGGDNYALGELFAGLACFEVISGLPSKARASAEESIVAAKAAGNPVLIARGNLFLGWALLERTELPAARAALETANAIATGARAQFWMNISRSLLAVVDLLEGSIDSARAELDDAAAEAVELLSVFGIAISLWCGGQAARAAGDVEAARTIMSRGVPVQAGTGLRWLGTWSLASLAELEARSGDLAGARAHIDETHEVAGVLPNTIAEGHIHLARAAVAVANDELEGAEDAVHQALRLFADSRHRQGAIDSIERLAWLLARLESHAEAARLLGAAGSARSALGYLRFPADVDAFQDVEDLCRESLGAEAFGGASKEGAELSLEEAIGYASRGRGTRKRPSAGWASLTPAELDVVRLVTEGLTNAAIGKRLFISPRTVQAHLARIFGKLGVGSRTELAAEAIKRGSEPS